MGEMQKPINSEVYNPYRRLTESQKLNPQEFPFPQYVSSQNIQNGNRMTNSAVNVDVYQAPSNSMVLITELTITIILADVIGSGGILVLTDGSDNELSTVFRHVPDGAFSPNAQLLSINMKTAILLTSLQKLRCRTAGSSIIAVNALGYRVK